MHNIFFKIMKETNVNEVLLKLRILHITYKFHKIKTY